VLAVAFSRDGRRLASAGWEQAVKVWEPEEGQEVLTLRGHGGAVTGVAFGKDDAFLATGSADTTVKLWDARR
jgi:WD40 repeat protein